MHPRHEPGAAWLPSTQELGRASERAILALLDANLQLAIRTLRAEYPGLDRHGRIIEDPNWEPYLPPQVPLIEHFVRSAALLRGLIAHYHEALEAALESADTEDCAEVPAAGAAEEDNEIPF